MLEVYVGRPCREHTAWALPSGASAVAAQRAKSHSMASLGHIAVGVAAARWEATRRHPLLTSLFASMVLYAGLSLLPDADVLGFALGVPYADAWGHRGATHSLVFAALIGLCVASLAAVAARPFWRTWLLVSCVVGSHGLLDMLTDGGLGVALLWPLSTTRYFAPVTPLPVAPIGRSLASARGLYVIAVEALLFLPLFWYAFQRRR